MAIFASTTTSGYSDPLKALTIKALEKRQADMLAQQATQEAGMFKPENTQTPIQGIAQVANVAADAFRQNRTDAAIAAQRDTLSKAMTGYDPLNGPPPPAAAAIDPDLYKSLLSQWAETRRNAATNATTSRGQDVGAETARGGQAVTREGQQLQATTAREGHDVTRSEGAATRQSQYDLATQAQRAHADLAAAEREFKGAQAALDRANQDGTTQQKIDAQAKLAEAQQKHELARDAANNAFKATQPKSDVGAVSADVKAGIVPPEVGAEATSKLTAPSPAQVTAQTNAATTYRAHAQSLDKLNEAKAILAHPGGINVGPWAGAKTGATLGAADVPVIGGMVSKEAKEKAQRTNDFNSIINENAIKEMSQTLKGQSTDFEMKKFIEVLNNPSSTPEHRKAQLDRLIAAAEVDKGTHANALKQLRGDPAAIDAQLGASKQASSTGDVKAVASEAEAMKLPPNTKFKLPDGRTGTAQ
jgi:hypothetical protein